jgi:hypothetical protein
MNSSKNKTNKHTEVFQSFNIIVFGGDGDLALRKIFPAIFHRNQDGQLLCPYNVVAITRNKPEETKFKEDLISRLPKYLLFLYSFCCFRTNCSNIKSKRFSKRFK